jgi:ketosteroid isomerase-like protein
MARSDAGAVASTCLKAWTTGDLATTRSVLADDVTFVGLLGETDGIDAYMRGIEGLAKIVERADQQQLIVDGDDVCIIYDLVTSTPPATLPTEGWYHVVEGKITSVRAYFDPRPLLADAG